MRYLFFISILTISLLFNSITFGQTKSLKIGVVQTETVLKEMPEAVSADKEIRELQKQYSDSLGKLQDDFMKKYDTYTKQKTMMNADQQKKEEESLTIFQNQILQFRDQVVNIIAKKRDELLAPIKTKIMAAIEQVAKEEKINLVLEKGTDAVLYSEDEFDLTFKVLDKIKRGGVK
ncbi:MAG: OmpH family outer membrane protein [Candidatus Woesearchaeota archaeon]